MSSDNNQELSREEIIALIHEVAFKFRVCKIFLTALVETESGFVPNATRYEKNYKWIYSAKEMAEALHITKESVIELQKRSYGLTQLMGAVFMECGFRGMPSRMLDPRVNLTYCCMFLERLMVRHNVGFDDPQRFYAIYNAGSVRRKPNGELVNQGNVDRFMRIYRAWQSSLGIS